MSAILASACAYLSFNINQQNVLVIYLMHSAAVAGGGKGAACDSQRANVDPLRARVDSAAHSEAVAALQIVEQKRFALRMRITRQQCDANGREPQAVNGCD
jgi:hypothetical protein